MFPQFSIFPIYLGFVIGILPFVLVTSANASFISLKTDLNAKIDGDRLKVLVSVVNKGDEAAHNVQAEIKALDKRFLGEKAAEVGINQTYNAVTEFALNKDKPGIYPLILTMYYTDANQYPFSALTVQAIAYKADDVPGNIFGRLASAGFWQTGETKLAVKNLSNQEIKVLVGLITPRELRVTVDKQIVTVPPRGVSAVHFPIENLSALSGSNYQVFAVMEYDQQGSHQTSLAPGLLKIFETRNFLGLNYANWFFLLAILLIVFMAIQFGWVKTKK